MTVSPLVFVPSLGSHPRFIKENGVAGLVADQCVGYVVKVGRFPGTRVVERLRDPARTDGWAIEQAEYHLKLAQQGEAPEYPDAD